MSIPVVSTKKKSLGKVVAVEKNRNARLEEKNAQILKAKKIAEASNRAKSRFLCDMSHEIRTPMNAVIGFTDLLLETELTDLQVEYVRTIQQSGIALLSIINDIVDLSKIESGELDFEAIPFDPELLAYDVCNLVKPKTIDKPVELLCRIDDHLPAMVKGDPLRFRQVLTNLLDNAQKFTDAGEIELSLQLADQKKKGVKLQASIRDTGIGIPFAKQKSIFEPFRQSERNTARKYGGSGLGLSICRKIARMMGGNVWMESSKRKGSTFHFSAWLEKSEKLPDPQLMPVTCVGKRILVVDDNRTNLEILDRILTAAGMVPTTTHRSEKALSILEAALQDATPFQLCMADIRMPHLDGYAVAEQIRSAESRLSKIPLIALSNSPNRDAKRCEKAGFNGFLSKPVRRKKLFQMIDRILQQNNRPGDDTKISPKKIHTQYSVREELKHAIKILLAEDNPVNQRLTEIMLKNAGYKVTVVGDGTEAVDTFIADPENFDLIFMDIQMPEMDGKEATEKIRGKGFTQIPIIAMTAHAMAEDKKLCVDAGMNGYITKPIKRETVFAEIKKYVYRETVA